MPELLSKSINEKIKRRRTFAIISHPDAGKTTLTEKLLLYSNAIHLAGSVTARKNQNSTASDWMEMEKKRGISVSSTVLQFQYNDYIINLLDTPGHHDFSEDTYRVLSAVDSTIMIIDAGKGIEAQTLKLFKICKDRKIPIFVFINKLDRPSRPPLELIDELETVLKIDPVPINWPIGDGIKFKGVFNRENNIVNLFEKTPHGSHKAPISCAGIHDDIVKNQTDENTYKNLVQEIELLEIATQSIDIEKILSSKQMPIFFGSAMNNFGIKLMLDKFLNFAPSPASRKSSDTEVYPNLNTFSGFVFKIQANMNPKHRDKAIFIRIVSGVFKRDMQVIDNKSGKKVRLSNAQKLFGKERETLDEAYAGDILALIGNYNFLIGDTISDDPKIKFNEIPHFKPECFAYLRNNDTSNIKRYRDGINQLLKEGVSQAYDVHGSAQKIPLLGAVGPLQFEVMKARLENEYKVESNLEQSPWSIAQWINVKIDNNIKKYESSIAPSIDLPTGCSLACDDEKNWVVLLSASYLIDILKDRNKSFLFSDNPK